MQNARMGGQGLLSCGSNAKSKHIIVLLFGAPS